MNLLLKEAFWMLVTIIEDLLPAEYYSGNMIGKTQTTIDSYNRWFVMHFFFKE